jgi:FkbM family methyltransferase
MPKRMRLPCTYIYQRILGSIEPELLILQHLVSARGLAIDVGANMGIWSYKLSKLFAGVEAFEPIPECAAAIETYGAKNIRVHREALSAIAGEFELNIPVSLGTAFATFNDIGDEHNSIMVATRTLDSYPFRDVSFIKIDVEGWELDVIRGSESTIARECPIMIIEIEQRHLNYDMNIVFDTMHTFGYDAFFLHHSKLHSYSEFSYKTHQEPFLENYTSVDYINNFIFKPRTSVWPAYLL